MENVMNDLMYDLPNNERGSKIRITKKLALDQIGKSSINPTLK
jgi:ATP-dependent protease Clp ATPase subunit